MNNLILFNRKSPININEVFYLFGISRWHVNSRINSFGRSRALVAYFIYHPETSERMEFIIIINRRFPNKPNILSCTFREVPNRVKRSNRGLKGKNRPCRGGIWAINEGNQGRKGSGWANNGREQGRKRRLWAVNEEEMRRRRGGRGALRPIRDKKNPAGREPFVSFPPAGWGW